MIYGSIPAGGRGTRLQPIGFSKELAYVGGTAIIEHLIERMVIAGIKNIFINTASDKTDKEVNFDEITKATISHLIG